MTATLRWLAIFIMATVRERHDLALENLALRQQLGMLKRRHEVPRLKKTRITQQRSPRRPQVSSEARALIKQMASTQYDQAAQKPTPCPPDSVPKPPSHTRLT